MPDEIYQIGSIPLTVRSFGDNVTQGVPSPFVALVPATDLTRLPATLDVLHDLLDAGCSSLVLAGPRADTYREQVGLVIEEHGSTAEIQPLSDLNDACNATVFAALIHKAGLALCANDFEILETLRGVAKMNGWTLAPPDTAKIGDVAKPAGLSDPSEKPAPTSKPVAKAKSKPVAKSKPAAKAKAKPAARAKPTKVKPAAKAKAAKSKSAKKR